MHSNGFAAVNGTRLYYEVTGSGIPLVLLHSGYTDLRLWDYQFEQLGKHFTVIRYDIRGFGRSDRPSEQFSHFQDLKALLDYFGVEKVHLIGVSMGGSIAIDFTLEFPSMVGYLILSGSSISGFKPAIDDASRKRSIAGMSIVTRDQYFNQSVEFMLEDPMWRQSSSTARQHLKKMFLETSLSWLLDEMVQPPKLPVPERLSEISNRTLLIIGSEDSEPIFESARFSESKIATSQKVIINGTGHLPNLDKPEEFNKIALSFLL